MPDSGRPGAAGGKEASSEDDAQKRFPVLTEQVRQADIPVLDQPVEAVTLDDELPVLEETLAVFENTVPVLEDTAERDG